MQSAGPEQHPILLELTGQMATGDIYPTDSTVYVINVTLTEVIELKQKTSLLYLLVLPHRQRASSMGAYLYLRFETTDF